MEPDLRILPPSQRELWDELSVTPSHFVLYGGTALALRLGHRTSVDFDFFSPDSFDPMALQKSVSYLKGQTVTERSENTLTCEVTRPTGVVKISFFGGLTLRQVEPPERTVSNGVAIASLSDLFGTKCAAVTQRSQTRDYVDIHALLKSGMDLSHGVSCARAIYGEECNPMLILRALAYFKDIPDLPDQVKQDLLAAVQSVALDNLPSIEGAQKIGAMAPRRHR